MAAAVENAEQEVNVQSLDLTGIFRLWEEKHTAPGYDPVPILSRYGNFIFDFSCIKNST